MPSRAKRGKMSSVVIDFDGVKRHHSKRAFCKRRADQDKAHLQRIELRTRLVPLLHEPNPTDETEKEKKAISTKLRALEAQTRQILPTNFVAALTDFQQEYNSLGKGIIFIGHAPWQADPCIAKAAIDGDIEGILSGDSDFSMYVGRIHRFWVLQKRRQQQDTLQPQLRMQHWENIPRNLIYRGLVCRI